MPWNSLADWRSCQLFAPTGESPTEADEWGEMPTGSGASQISGSVSDALVACHSSDTSQIPAVFQTAEIEIDLFYRRFATVRVC
jgi:hypothetical protein